ncbi:MAG: hypothetical protein KME30_26330 [Iphinoe sp. HA4291-MV1]|jgi:hypothetical protein|nr:hypothetical protein [Iphinoe sp. HA4291-MV1]
MYSHKLYRFEKPILYNNVNTESLYGATIRPEKVAYIAPLGRRILAGSFLAAGERLLPRARIISPYFTDSNYVIVSNPAVFQAGDVLKVIGTPSSTPLEEAAAVLQGTAATFGTVVSVDAASRIQITTVIPDSVAVGNVFVLSVEEVSISYVATAATVKNVVEGLKAVFDGVWGRSDGRREIRADITVGGDGLIFTSFEPGEIFVVKGMVAQGIADSTGTLNIEVTQPVGALNITPVDGNGDYPIGTKIGTITDVPLGVIGNEYLLTDEDGIDYERSVSAYNKAAVFTKSLPYLDGAIVQQLPGLSFMPVYDRE